MTKIILIFTIAFCNISLLLSDEPCEYPIFDYNQFDLTRVIPVGHALLKNDIIYLTENFNNQTGAAWKNTPIDVSGGFSTSFTFEFRNGDNRQNYDGSLEGGDGVAFVIAGEPFGVGSYGAGIGYNGLKRAIAIEFDSYRNNVETLDPNGNHLAFQVQDNLGNVTSKHSTETTLAMNDSIMLMKDFVKYKVKIVYSSTDKKITVYFDTLEVPQKIALEVKNIDLSKYLDKPKACFVGITGGTGVAVANQYLHSWQFCQRAIPTSVDDDKSLRNYSELNDIYDEISIYNEIGERIIFSNSNSIQDLKHSLPKNQALLIFAKTNNQFKYFKMLLN